MLKKLLVAVLALTMLIGLCSSALANKPAKTLETEQIVGNLEPRTERGTPGCTQYVGESHHGSLYTTFGLPNAYGSSYPNTRFTNDVAMEVDAVWFILVNRAYSAGVGITAYVWNSDPNGFPDLANELCTSIPINPIVFGVPIGYGQWFGIDLTGCSYLQAAFNGDFNVGFSPIVNLAGQRISLGVDNGALAEGRSSFGYDNGAGGYDFYAIADDGWGADYAFQIELDKCVTPDPACVSTANPLDQWPIWGHDFGRSSQSGISLGTDICGIALDWKYDLGLADGAYKQMARTSPLVVDDKVYVVYTDRLVCLNLLTGSPIWSTRDQSYHDALQGAALLSAPAIEDGWLYMGTGAAVAGGPAGFMRVNAATGALGWGRGGGLGLALPGTAGNTQVCPPVIIGDKVFFGNQNGVVHALDKATGATLYYTTLPMEASIPAATAKLMGSMSTDGTRLFIGTCNAAGTPVATGRVYCLVPGVADFGVVGVAPNWTYNQPAAVQAAYPGGFWSAPSYRNGNLFIQSVATFNALIGGSCTGTGWGGYRQNLDPVTGASKWFADALMGSARNAPPGTMCIDGEVTALFANYFTSGCPGNAAGRGVRAVNTFNSTVWTNPGNDGEYENQVYCAVTSTQDPWVFSGTADPYGQNALHPDGGNWVITNGLTGDIEIQYAMTGMVNGTAIAHGSDGNDWIVVTTQMLYNRTLGALAGSGLVYAFRDMGPRPRLILPTGYVEFPSTNDDEALPGTTVQRTATGAIVNGGCAPMTYTTALSDGALMMTKLSTVSFTAQEQAANLAKSLIDYTVEDLTPCNAPLGDKTLLSRLVQNEEGDWYLPASQVKPAVANSARLAVPDWVVWVSGESDLVGIPAGGAADFTFEFDLTKMNKLGVNIFYVQVSTNDPDADPEKWPGAQGVQAEIAYSLPYMYCATNIDVTHFGTTGVAWANNIGLLGNSNTANEFAPTGAGDVMYTGSMFYAKDMNSAAWNPISGTGAWDPLVNGGFLYGFYPSGEDCGGCVKTVNLPVASTPDGGLSYAWVVGDICTFAMVDSGQDMGYWPYQDGPSMGILVKYREVTAYGAAYGRFKLTVQDIINRNATPINGLYYGAFADWDVGAADVGGGDGVKGYIYQYYGGAAYGFIGLPSKGNYWPDGTPTDPMYNGQILHSRDTYWNEEQFDSLYNWVNLYPQDVVTILPPVVAGTDKAMMTAFGKADLGAYGQKTFGFATFGFSSGFTGPTDVDNLRKFVNKFSGFGRGDVNNDNVINLLDLVRLSKFAPLAGPPLGPGPIPFRHLGDVDNSGVVDHADVVYLSNYFFYGGTPPKSTFLF
jgi:hypothetical protein